jgi:lysophospholipase
MRWRKKVNGSVRVEEGNYQTRDRICIKYRVWLPDKPKNAVILIHGAGENMEIFHHLWSFFVQSGMAFILFDLRGFGASGGKCGHVTTFQDYLDDVNELFHYFQENLKVFRFYVIGHSLGGLIATRLVQDGSDHIEGIVLSAPALELRFEIPVIVQRFIAVLSRTVPSLSANPTRLVNGVMRVPVLKKHFQWDDWDSSKDDVFVPLKYSCRWTHELLTEAKKAVLYAEKFTIPVLCICGKNDTLIHSDKVGEFINRVSATDKKWVVIPDVGHRLLHSGESAATIEMIIDWIQQRLDKQPLPST